ncbi:MAG: glycosyltransferase family 2 protein [Zetaproteobacteria bacterium]|nr:glycosyltransferase family 2 protein [Zetaproteobacteria bacterium]
MQLSLIIPAYNEAQRLPQTLGEMFQWLDAHLDMAYEILVIDDGSTDDTLVLLAPFLISRQKQFRLIEQPHNLGKGAAVRRGMLEARGDIRIFLDADHSTHIRECTKVISAMQSGADVVIASRQHPQSIIPIRQSWLRERMGKTFNRLMRLMIQLEFIDTQCGFKACSAQAAIAIFTQQQLDGFSFDVEMLYLAKRSAFNISEIPIEWRNESNSKVRMLVDPMLMFVDIVRIRRLHKKIPIPQKKIV